MTDITNLARIGGVDAERTATQLFGMAVEQFAATPINAGLKALYPGESAAPVNRNDGSWHSTDYAASLANSEFRPKLKFLFRVEFLFHDAIMQQFSMQAATWKNKFTFLIKSVDRPKIDFEYEAINQYNFRTQVLKQIKHKALSMAFTDDVGNNVHEFFRFMMMVHSPITRRSVGASDKISDEYAAYSSGNGMLFSDDFGNVNDFAHRGVMNTEVGNAIKAIKVTQLFMVPGNTPSDLDTGAREVSFLFINPRIEAFDLDDVDHAESQGNVFTMQFDYDFMVMGQAHTLQALDPAKSLPAVGGAPGEPQPTGKAGAQSPGENNPYAAILAGVGSRAVQRIVSETIGRKLRLIPGLGSVADTLGGIVQGISKTALGGFINQASARPSREMVIDTSVAGQAKSAYATSTGSFGNDQPAPGVYES